MSSNYIIAEDYVLPSKGLIYSTPVNAHVKLRSMTIADEARRLAPSNTPYKVLCDVIDDCMLSDVGISTYDMCIGDYQYLLHRLRVVTYGKDYKMVTRCTNCGGLNKSTIDLDTLKVNEYEESLKDLLAVELPMTGKKITLRYMTPRLLDDIEANKKTYKEKTKKNDDQTLVYTLMALIETIDGKQVPIASLENFIRQMPMKDANIILQKADEFNERLGLDLSTIVHCDQCGEDFTTFFRLTSEFFGPRSDSRW